MNKENVEHLEWIYGRMVDIHGENPRVDYMNRFKKIIDTAKESVIIGQQPTRYNMVAPDGKQWIDLDIDNLPDRFFTRDDIEIECQQKEGEWTWQHMSLSERAYMIINIDHGYKYRYRIQEKKPIQIDKDIYCLIEKYNPKSLSVKDGEGWFYMGRPIIID